MLKYIVNAGELEDAEQFLDGLSSHLPEGKEVIMTIAQQLEKKGMQKGIESAAKTLLLTGTLSAEKIAQTLNIPLERVMELAKTTH